MIIPNSELPGWMSDDDLNFLMGIASNKDCVEIGCWKGRTSLHLLMVCRSLVCIDPWEGLENYPNGDFNNDGNVLHHFVTNITKNYTHRGKYLEIIKKPATLAERDMHPSREFDVVFIDGNHDYECVLEDIVHWVGHIRIGGWLCGHDYHTTQPQCIRAVQNAIGGAEKLTYAPMGLDNDNGVWAIRIDTTEQRDEIRNRVLAIIPDVLCRNSWQQQGNSAPDCICTASNIIRSRP